MPVFLSGLMPCCPQYLLEWWVFGCLFVGWLLVLGGARAAGAALIGSSVGAFVSLFTPFHSGHLESLCTAPSSWRASAWSRPASRGSPWEPPTRSLDTPQPWPSPWA